MFEYIWTYPSSPGRPSFSRSRSFTHHNHDHHHHNNQNQNHHHHHHSRSRSRPRCYEDCAGVSLEEWDSLCRQNKDTLASNEVLTRENETLKTDLRVSTEENARLVAANLQLTEDAASLRGRSQSHEDALRRRITVLSREVEAKDRDVRLLEKDNGTLATRVKVITDTMSDQGRQVKELAAKLADWRKTADDFQRLYDDFRGRYEKARRLLAARARELDESAALVDEQRRRLARYEGKIPSRPRRYSFI
ncbi:hypothetical protein M426DRAFT_323808 [Hypoxylon sp. CI-4A]|nr:hypothetical protein M426DRAFT_323808 [Hypoxylon sp. CI-4A]